MNANSCLEKFACLTFSVFFSISLYFRFCLFILLVFVFVSQIQNYRLVCIFFVRFLLHKSFLSIIFCDYLMWFAWSHHHSVHGLWLCDNWTTRSSFAATFGESHLCHRHTHTQHIKMSCIKCAVVCIYDILLSYMWESHLKICHFVLALKQSAVWLKLFQFIQFMND